MHYQYVSKLSGGEKRRLYLLTILMKNPNFLILDEPTNDLDVFTLSVLEDYLETFEGCVLVVTHDRYFMDRIVDHIFYFEGEGKVKDILGNYSVYRETLKSIQAEERKEELRIKSEKEEQRQMAEQRVPVAEKRKISFKEKFEFEQLDKEIPQLEMQKKELETKLGSGALSMEELSLVSEQLGKLSDDLDNKTLRWMELADLVNG
jgi:ATP-binding cassette subfamily F protein uup